MSDPFGSEHDADIGVLASSEGTVPGGTVDVSAVTAIVFCLGGVMFYLLLYRSRIVPRWIALWGLVAAPFYVAAFLLPMYDVIGTDSAAQSVLYLPLAVQEMVLAVWMIARGFRPLSVASVRPD